MISELKLILEKIERADLVEFSGVKLDGPNVRGKNFGETPLHIIAVWGDLEAAKVLVAAGAELDVAGENNYTALHEAIGHGHVHLVRFLLESGADPYRTCDTGNAFELAELHGHVGILKAAQIFFCKIGKYFQGWSAGFMLR